MRIFLAVDYSFTRIFYKTKANFQLTKTNLDEKSWKREIFKSDIILKSRHFGTAEPKTINKTSIYCVELN